MAATAETSSDVIIGDDGLPRCAWAVSHPLNMSYHDTEWGEPVHTEQGLYERICLEAFQAGLSWLTILSKRAAFRAAFADFDPVVVAEFDADDVNRLLADRGIVRNRAKILAAIRNAQATLRVRELGGLDGLVWSHQPTAPLLPRVLSDLPTRTPESKALSVSLRSHGFTFVGPTTAEALMKAIGMVDAHLVGCHRRGNAVAVAAAR